MKLLIKYATRERPEQFISCIHNIVHTIGYDNYQVLVSYDITDGTMTDEVIENAKRVCPNLIAVRGDNQSKVQAINANMDLVTDWDWLVNMSDDMSFAVGGWARKMLSDIRKRCPDGTNFFAHFSDGCVTWKLPTMTVIGREAYEMDGYIYHPSYLSVSCDAEALFVAMMRGHYYYFPDLYFRHLHPCNGYGQTDNLYNKNGKHEPRDTANYFARRRERFNITNPIVLPFDPDNKWSRGVS